MARCSLKELLGTRVTPGGKRVRPRGQKIHVLGAVKEAGTNTLAIFVAVSNGLLKMKVWMSSSDGRTSSCCGHGLQRKMDDEGRGFSVVANVVGLRLSVCG